MKCCPTCGQTLPDPRPFNIRGAVRRRLLERIIKAGKNGVARETLFSHLYSSDPNGGPDTGLNIISVHVVLLNKTLVKHGKKIENVCGRGGRSVAAMYRLVDL